MNFDNRIVIDPEIRSGKPCIKGTRITVYDILEYLAGGMAEDDILRDFPALSRDDIRAVLEFTAPRTPGLMKGRIRVGRDFDAPLPGALLDAFEGKPGSR